ncbi:hypothetical protein CYMTET_18206, partial [Cymbomonas tetramitiformis]
MLPISEPETTSPSAPAILMEASVSPLQAGGLEDPLSMHTLYGLDAMALGAGLSIWYGLLPGTAPPSSSGKSLMPQASPTTSTDSNSDTDSDTDSDIDYNTDSDIDYDTDSDTGFDTDSDIDADTDSGSDIDTDTDSDIDSDSNLDFDTDIDSDFSSDSESQSDSDSEEPPPPVEGDQCGALPCHVAAACIEGQCKCLAGYAGDGIACVDVDECEWDAAPCGSNSMCINLEGLYECQCMTGYAVFQRVDGTSECIPACTPSEVWLRDAFLDTLSVGWTLQQPQACDVQAELSFEVLVKKAGHGDTCSGSSDLEFGSEEGSFVQLVGPEANLSTLEGGRFVLEGGAGEVSVALVEDAGGALEAAAGEVSLRPGSLGSAVEVCLFGGAALPESGSPCAALSSESDSDEDTDEEEASTARHMLQALPRPLRRAPPPPPPSSPQGQLPVWGLVATNGTGSLVWVEQAGSVYDLSPSTVQLRQPAELSLPYNISAGAALHPHAPCFVGTVILDEREACVML